MGMFKGAYFRFAEGHEIYAKEATYPQISCFLNTLLVTDTV